MHRKHFVMYKTFPNFLMSPSPLPPPHRFIRELPQVGSLLRAFAHVSAPTRKFSLTSLPDLIGPFPSAMTLTKRLSFLFGILP